MYEKKEVKKYEQTNIRRGGQFRKSSLNPCKIRKIEILNNIIFKDVKEFNIIFLILISIFLVGISGYSSYAIFSNEIISNNEIKGVVKKQIVTGANILIKKVGSDGLVAESHPATSQLAATTDYRYTGKNPNNYIKFNNETWRIIGVFDVDDGTGNIEKRIKIIRDNLGKIAWDSNNVNDWSKASTMQLLNTGDYYNRTGSYASTGLTAEAKKQIADAKWYLGGTEDYASASNGLASHFYSYERGTAVYFGGRPTSWVGEVGLMYPSDYGYATSGGTSMNRAACLAKEMYKWDSANDCKNNNWLYDSSNNQWTITPNSGYFDYGFNVRSTGSMYVYCVSLTHAFQPSIYLKSDIEITGGNGSSATPYEISK